MPVETKCPSAVAAMRPETLLVSVAMPAEKDQCSCGTHFEKRAEMPSSIARSWQVSTSLGSQKLDQLTSATSLPLREYLFRKKEDCTTELPEPHHE